MSTRLPTGELVRRALIWTGYILLFWEAVVVCLPSLSAIRDLHQDYLMGMALRHGESPYQPTNLLWERFFATPYRGGIIHPSPHPPLIACIFWPLSYLPYWLVGLLWLGASIGAVLLGVKILVHRISTPSEYISPIVALFLLSVVGRHDLLMGQINTFFFLGIVLLIVALDKKNELIAGALIGVMMSAKFFGAPLFLYLLVKRGWKICIGALVAASIVAAVIVTAGGTSIVKDYWTHAATPSLHRYSGMLANLSWSAIVTRMTTQYEEVVTDDGRIRIKFPDEVNDGSPQHTPISSSLVGVIIVCVGLVVALTKNFETGLHRALLLSCLATPVAWNHYLIPCVSTIICGLVPLWRNAKFQNKKELIFRCGWPLLLLALAMAISPELVAQDLFEILHKAGGTFVVPWWVKAAAITPTLLCLVSVFTLQISPNKEKVEAQIHHL